MTVDLCPNCGHAEYVHEFFVGRCIHGEMKPKDGLDCDCESTKRIDSSGGIS